MSVEEKIKKFLEKTYKNEKCEILQEDFNLYFIKIKIENFNISFVYKYDNYYNIEENCLKIEKEIDERIIKEVKK